LKGKKRLSFYAPNVGPIKAHLIHHHSEIHLKWTAFQKSRGNLNDLEETIQKTIEKSKAQLERINDPLSASTSTLLASFQTVEDVINRRHLSNIYYLFHLICNGIPYNTTTDPLLDESMRLRGTAVFPDRHYFSSDLLDTADDLVARAITSKLAKAVSLCGYSDGWTGHGQQRFLLLGFAALLKERNSDGNDILTFYSNDFDCILIEGSSNATSQLHIVDDAYDRLVRLSG
jgi:hypothetical protein